MFRLWRLWRLGARDFRRLWYALNHPIRPTWLWPVVIVLGFYALDPFNFVVPVLGVVDDLVTLPLLLHLLKKLPLKIRSGFDETRA